MSEPATKRTDVIAKYEEMRFGIFLNLPMKDDLIAKGEMRSWPEAFSHPIQPVTDYCPTNLNLDELVSLVKKVGAKYAVLNVKEGFGFCYYPSKYTDYDIEATEYKTDIVAEFVNLCRKYDIAPCLHYCLGVDLAHHQRYDGKGMTDKQYLEFAMNQITELLTNYGQITTLWFSGLGVQGAEWLQEVYNRIKSLQPNCLVIMHRSDLNLWPTDVFQPGRKLPPAEGHNPWIKHNGKTYYIPMEVFNLFNFPNVEVTRDYGDTDKDGYPSIETFTKRYKDTVSKGANFNLSIILNSDGTLPKDQVQKLIELTDVIKKL